MNPLWFFWGQETMSFLRFATLASACRVHEDVRLVVRRPAIRPEMAWRPMSTQDFQYAPPIVDWMPKAMELPLTVIDIRDVALSVNSMNACDSITKDFLMYHLMATQGGTFADMDIIFWDKIPDVLHDVQVPKIETGRPVDRMTNRERDAWQQKIRKAGKQVGSSRLRRSLHFPTSYIPVGFVQGRPSASWANAFRLAVERYDPRDYQCCVFCLDQDIPGSIPATIVYPWAPTPISKVIGFCFSLPTWPEMSTASIGLHWYAGGSQKWNQNINGPEDLPDAAIRVAWKKAGV